MLTIDKLAKLANVSKSTASKALNNRHDVSPETKRIIQEIAKEHNYIPNAFGKSLKSKITKNIGAIFTREKHSLSNNPFFSRILEGIEAECALNNYNLILNIIPDNSTKDLPKMIRERMVDGIILIGVFNEKFIERINSSNIRVLQIDPNIELSSINQVFIDNEHGAFMATQYLIKAGHRKIGFVSGSLDRLSFKQRLDGYLKALEYNNIKPDDELIRCWGIEDGYTQVKNLLTQKKPTAIFATNDLNALMGYNAVQDMNLRIPDDVSIIGFDDIWSANLANPPLTTVRVYKEELGSIGVRTLLKAIGEHAKNPMNVILPVKLIERQSVRRI